MPTRLVTDDRGVDRVRTATLLLIGADAVSENGSVVHKVGTRRLAAAARRASVPVYVVSGRSKWTGEKRAPRHLPPFYDVTPGPWIAAYFTDGGRLPGRSASPVRAP